MNEINIMETLNIKLVICTSHEICTIIIRTKTRLTLFHMVCSTCDDVDFILLGFDIAHLIMQCILKLTHFNPYGVVIDPPQAIICFSIFHFYVDE